MTVPTNTLAYLTFLQAADLTWGWIAGSNNGLRIAEQEGLSDLPAAMEAALTHLVGYVLTPATRKERKPRRITRANN
jgi:hypothetical protein